MLAVFGKMASPVAFGRVITDVEAGPDNEVIMLFPAPAASSLSW